MPDLDFLFPAAVTIQAGADTSVSPRCSILAYTGGIMQISGYGPLAIDLAGLELPSTTPLLVDHNAKIDGIAGSGVAHVENHQLFVEGSLVATSAAAQNLVALSKGGVPLGASVGVQPLDREFVKAGTTISVNGQTIVSPSTGFTLVRKGRLREVSLLAVAADSNTTVQIAAQLTGTISMPSTTTIDTTPIFARWNKAELTPEARETLQPVFASALSGEASYADFENSILKAELSAAQLRAQRAERPRVDGLGGSPVQAGSADVIQAALLAHMGHEDIGEKTLGAQAMQRGRDLRCHSFMDILKAGLIAEGRELPATQDGIIQAAFSTMSVPGILSNSANKILLNAYEAFPSAARIIAKKLTANDFKTHTGYRLTSQAVFEEVGPDGEIKHGQLGEAAYPFSVKTTAKMFGITRKDVINDDLGAFDSVPQALGRGSALALEEAFWTLVLANTGSFFGAGNKNFIDGAGSALSLAGLGLGVAAMLDATDDNGKPINVVPRWLLVPPCLKSTADDIYRSTTVVVGGASSAERVPSANSFFGLTEPVPCPYLSNASFPGFSTTGWYLFGNSADVAAFGIAYLNGNEQPTIEQNPAPFNKLGLEFRGVHDFGVCQLDPRGGLKSKGAQ